MKLPVAWLKKYIDPKLTAEELADRLTLTGTKVETVETHAGEPVIDIEITTNRPDCLSILGLAREVSAITGKTVSVPAAYTAQESRAAGKAPVAVRVEDKKACPYYTARLIENVRVGSTPAEAAKFLDLMGTRPISNVVDVTNYVLFESGQPLHAFDADKLEGGRIIVRRARAGETITGIDGNEYKLDPETLVIADAVRPVAIAGVIGGRLTEVTASTKRVLLESASFDPALVRRASKKFKISTESSYRFERRTDIRGVAAASRRASELIRAWAGGAETGRLIESAKLPKAPAGGPALRLSRLSAVLGINVSQARVLSIFKSLGLSAKASGAGKIAVRASSQRDDLKIEADLIEEVLRIEGFEKIPTTLPVTRHAASVSADRRPSRVRALKGRLASSGFREILTYSLLSSRVLEDTGFSPSEAPRIANAVSAEQEFLRPNLLPGLLGAVAFNVNRKASSLKLFEIGKRYSKQALGPADRFEETALALAVYGPFEENWKRKSDSSLSDAKGAIADALSFLGAPVEFRPAASPAWLSSCAEIVESGRVLGILGAVSEAARKRWDIPHEVFYAEAVIDEAASRMPATPRMIAIPKYPSVRRDLAFVIDRSVAVDRLAGSMREAGSPFVQEVRLFDEYTGKNIPAGKRSLAFALSYQKETGTFTDPEIQAIHGRVTDALKRDFQVEFR